MPGGLPGLGVLAAGLLHGRFRQADQPVALADAHRVLHPQVIEHAVGLGRGKAAVQTDHDLAARKGLPQFGHHPAHSPQGATTSGGLAGPETSQKEILVGLVVEGNEAQQRQEAPGVVVGVEEGEGLLSVGGIVGGIEVDDDPVGNSLESLAMPFDHQILDTLAHDHQGPGVHGVLETGVGGLGSQIRVRVGISAAALLEDRVGGDPFRIVAVGLAGGQGEDPLPKKIKPGVHDLARLTLIGQMPAKPLSQAKPAVQRGERRESSVPTLRGLVEVE